MSNVFGPGFASKNVDRYSSYPTLAQHNIYKAIYTECCARARITYLREDFTMKEKAFLLKAPTSFQLREGPSRGLLKRFYNIVSLMSKLSITVTVLD